MNQLREKQAKMLTYLCKKLSRLSGLECKEQDMSYLPEDCAHIELDNFNSVISFKFDINNFSEDDLDSVEVKLDSVRLKHSSISVDELFQLCDAISAIVKKECVVYFRCGLGGGAVEHLMDNLSICVKGGAFLLSEVEVDKATVDKFKKASDRGALSSFNISSISKADKKYKDFLLSRNPMDIGNNWYIIFDNE